MEFQHELVPLDSLLHPLIPPVRVMISHLPGLSLGSAEGAEMLMGISLQIPHGYLPVFCASCRSGSREASALQRNLNTAKCLSNLGKQENCTGKSHFSLLRLKKKKKKIKSILLFVQFLLHFPGCCAL